jgi:hypothetical protein
MSDASSSGEEIAGTPRTFRTMKQPVGPNPARLSPNQPVSTDRLVTEIPRICRENGPNSSRRRDFSHARGRRFETRRAHENCLRIALTFGSVGAHRQRKGP